MELEYTPSFVKQFNKLSKNLQEEVVEKIELFKDKNNHNKLKVHALHGKFKDCYSFHVNYSHRIVFVNKNKKTITLIKVGNHDIYK